MQDFSAALLNPNSTIMFSSGSIETDLADYAKKDKIVPEPPALPPITLPPAQPIITPLPPFVPCDTIHYRDTLDRLVALPVPTQKKRSKKRMLGFITILAKYTPKAPDQRKPYLCLEPNCSLKREQHKGNKDIRSLKTHVIAYCGSRGKTTRTFIKKYGKQEKRVPKLRCFACPFCSDKKAYPSITWAHIQEEHKDKIEEIYNCNK